MSRLLRTKSIAWFLVGWFGLCVTPLSQSLVVCVAASGHVRLETLGAHCFTSVLDDPTAAVLSSVYVPTNGWGGCNDIRLLSEYHRSNHRPSHQRGRVADGQKLPICSFVALLSNSDSGGMNLLPVTADPTRVSPLEHLSTTILIC